MRNNLFTLDPESAALARRNRSILAGAMSAGVEVAFTARKRETGEVSARAGLPVALGGAIGMSNECVTVETSAGPRTFNLWLITELTVS